MIFSSKISTDIGKVCSTKKYLESDFTIKSNTAKAPISAQQHPNYVQQIKAFSFQHEPSLSLQSSVTFRVNLAFAQPICYHVILFISIWRNTQIQQMRYRRFRRIDIEAREIVGKSLSQAWHSDLS